MPLQGGARQHMHAQQESHTRSRYNCVFPAALLHFLVVCIVALLLTACVSAMLLCYSSTLLVHSVLGEFQHVFAHYPKEIGGADSADFSACENSLCNSARRLEVLPTPAICALRSV